VTVSPPDGFMYDEKFTIEIQSSSKTDDLEYIVLGVLENGSEIRLTDDYVPLSE